MKWVEIAGYVASILVFSTFYMKTMIPLRCVAMASNVAFITYGAFGHLHPVLYLHCVLLPLNAVRLVQMRRLIADIKEASTGDLSFESMASVMRKERFPMGALLFRKGDAAHKLYILSSGTIDLPELGTAIHDRGAVIGEIGIFAPTGQRTASAICRADVEALTLSADRVLQLYYQNPKFGLYLLRLIVRRLAGEGTPGAGGASSERGSGMVGAVGDGRPAGTKKPRSPDEVSGAPAGDPHGT